MLEVVSCIGVLQLIKVDQVRPGDKARLLKGGSHSIPCQQDSSSTKQGCWTEVKGDRSRRGPAVNTSMRGGGGGCDWNVREAGMLRVREGPKWREHSWGA